MGQGEDSPQLVETTNDEESEAFENCHIQLYCLSKVPPASEGMGEIRKRSHEEGQLASR
jgi:hypothetical protein